MHYVREVHFHTLNCDLPTRTFHVHTHYQDMHQFYQRIHLHPYHLYILNRLGKRQSHLHAHHHLNLYSIYVDLKDYQFHLHNHHCHNQNGILDHWENHLHHQHIHHHQRLALGTLPISRARMRMAMVRGFISGCMGWGLC